MLSDDLLGTASPTSELTVETTKAKIYRTPSGKVVKHYLTDDSVQRASHDKHSLSYLHARFGEVHLNGWRYFTPKFYGLGINGESIEMEYVSGLPLSKIPRIEIDEAEYRAGVWLAHYHNKIIGDSNYGLIFSDYNVHNIMADLQKKQIAAIDPGGLWGNESNVYEDIVHHIFSLLVVLILKRRASLKTLRRFVDGYVEVRIHPFDAYIYFLGVFSAFRWKRHRFGKKPIKERVSFYAMLIAFLAPIYLLAIPCYAFLRQRHFRKNYHLAGSEKESEKS